MQARRPKQCPRLGDPQSTDRWHYRAPTKYEAALETIDPLSPEVLLHKYLVTEYTTKAKKDVAVKKLKSDSGFLSVEDASLESTADSQRIS